MKLHLKKDSRKILHELANFYGIQISYFNALKQRQEATDHSLYCALQSMRVPVGSEKNLSKALHRTQINYWQKKLEPIAVVWDQKYAIIPIRLTSQEALDTLECTLKYENGDSLNFNINLASLPILNSNTVDNFTYITKAFSLPHALTMGYHQLQVRIKKHIFEILLISAPATLYADAEKQRSKFFGIFSPIYALKTAQTQGCGDLTAFKNLIDWAGKNKAGLVGTLPLHAAFLDKPFEFSPYSPVSRLFWNEIFIDLNSLTDIHYPEIDSSFHKTNQNNLVDYKEIYHLKRKFLAIAIEKLESNHEFKEQVSSFINLNPEVKNYAMFRTACEIYQKKWENWNETEKKGYLPEDFCHTSNFKFHLFSQFLFSQQFQKVKQQAQASEILIYLDMPLGIHRDGFDTWRYQNHFALNANIGSPPDPIFSDGQNWNIPPLNPGAIRCLGYQYFIQCLQTIMKQVDLLRIDHVMGLHRLFWIPENCEPNEGVYVKYPAEELYAILSIESHRHQVAVIGENLGTVPNYVNKMMQKRHLASMNILQYELDSEYPLKNPIPKNSLSGLNTHDMPPFAAYYQGIDIQESVRLNLLDKKQALDATKKRKKDLSNLKKILVKKFGEKIEPIFNNNNLADILTYSLLLLASSKSKFLMINIEDLWLETASQNIPTTSIEHPNWQRKLRYSIESFNQLKNLPHLLNLIREQRNSTQSQDTEKAKISNYTHRISRCWRGACLISQRSIHSVCEQRVAATKPELERRWVYTFSLFSDDDLHWFNEGSHFRLYEKFGARSILINGNQAVYFSLWAPNANYISVVGDFNHWDENSNPLSPIQNSGIWQGVIVGLKKGAVYKYFIHSKFDNYKALKADPYGYYHEKSPQTASIIWDLDYKWNDQEWMAKRSHKQKTNAPFAIYEVHLGSWMRVPEEQNRYLSYRETAILLADYVKKMGYTHVELMPIMEHPFNDSWGYQITGYYAPTSRFGTPQDFMFFVDYLHQNSIGVILDWVPSHFPQDEHGLVYFDGTHLYEHSDPRQGFHPDWKSAIFNYDRNEVKTFLISNALFWLDKYHIDGLRVDAVTSMLRLDYSRHSGEWIPNQYGGTENLGAIAFIRTLNEEVYKNFPDIQTIAEESTDWGNVSKPTYLGGLGFGFKWDMGWMHDTLRYFSKDPLYRNYHHHKLTFRMLYAFSENYFLPLSHDEVVYGKGSLLKMMPGDEWQKFANIRLLLGYMYAQPGKKILFMGNDFAQWDEWNFKKSLDWHLAELGFHKTFQKWVMTLNQIYRKEAALHEMDCVPEGFEWIDCNDVSHNTYSFLRKSFQSEEIILIIINAANQTWFNYQIGVPKSQNWKVLAHSNDNIYGGSGDHVFKEIHAYQQEFHGRPNSIILNLPSLSIIYLKLEKGKSL